MVVVSKKKGETKDAMFRKFSKMFIEEDIVKDVRDGLFYKKPSKERQEREKERLTRKHTKPRRPMSR